MLALPGAFLARPIAHRGLHDAMAGRVENSRASVRAAIASGFGIEIDLQLSRDGEAMVFHDATLERLTPEAGPVRGRDAAELSRIPLTGGGETIPTLSDLLAEVAGRVPLLVEIKDQDGALGPDTGVREARACEVITRHDGPVAVMSFNPHAVAACAAAAPSLPRGLVTCPFLPGDWPGVAQGRLDRLTAIADFDHVGAGFVSHHHRALNSPAIAGLKARGVPVLCWTVRSAAEEAAARRIADNVTFEGYLPAETWRWGH